MASAKNLDEFLRVLEQFKKGKIPKAEVLRVFNNAVGEQFLANLSKGRVLGREAQQKLLSVFDSRLVHFDDEFLRGEYNAFRETGGRASPVEWVRAYANVDPEIRKYLRRGDVLGENYEELLRSLELNDIEKVQRAFSADLTGFRDPELTSEYQRYLSQPRPAIKQSPVEWAKSRPRGSRARQRFEALMGENYKQVLNNQYPNPASLKVSSEALEGFRYIAPKDMRNPKKPVYQPFWLVKELRGQFRDLLQATDLGKHFEIDHMFEKRFLKSQEYPDLNSVNPDDLPASIVPKNPVVANQIPAKDKDLIHYVHSEKTRLLRDLIPYGKEDLYTPQQWWDAHVYVFRQLGVSEATILEELGETFNIIEAATRVKIVRNVRQSPDKFFPGKWRPMAKPMKLKK